MNRGSSVAGNKRKLSVAQLQAAADANIFQLFCGNGDPGNETDLDRVIESVNNGSNVELMKRSESLLRARQKKCNAALRHKQMQLRTVQILYEYEVEDANSLYMRAFTDLQEKLVKELTVVKNRVQASRRKISAQHINRQDHTSGKQSEEFKQNPEPQPVAGRSLRSTGIVGLPEERPSNGSKETGHSNSGSSSSSSTSSKRTLDSDQIILSERCIRSDFLTIVRDMKSRVAAASAIRGSTGGTSAADASSSIDGCGNEFTPVIVYDDLASFTVGPSPSPKLIPNQLNGTHRNKGQKYVLGDVVEVSSMWMTSQQDLNLNNTGDCGNGWIGTILCISHAGFILGVQDSAKRFSLLFGQIKNGSIAISPHDKSTAPTQASMPLLKPTRTGSSLSGTGTGTAIAVAGNETTTVDDDDEPPPSSYNGSSSSTRSDNTGKTNGHHREGNRSASAVTNADAVVDVQKAEQSPSKASSSLGEMDLGDIIALATLSSPATKSATAAPNL